MEIGPLQYLPCPHLPHSIFLQKDPYYIFDFVLYMSFQQAFTSSKFE